MSLPQVHDHELLILLEKLIDNNLEPQEASFLNETLEADPLARQKYVEFIKMHVNIQWHAIHRTDDALQPHQVMPETVFEDKLLSESASPATAVLSSLNTTLNSQPLQPQLGFLANCIHQTMSFLTRPAGLSIMLAFLSITCGLLTLALLSPGLFVAETNNLNPPTANQKSNEKNENVRRVAYVLKATNDAQVANDSLPIQQGTELRAGIIRLTRGKVRIQFNQGAIVTLQAPAVFELKTKQKAVLLSGALQATVSPEAVGFIVDTPFVEVEDLGTKFSVWVKEEQWAIVSVEQGKVNARSGSGNSKDAPILLTRGQAARFTSTGNRTELINQENSTTSGRYLPFQPLITNVSSNTDSQYQVVHRGFDEDTKAYTDRAHEWNGVSLQGLPLELVGADYIMTSRADEADPNLQVKVTLSKPVILYVLFDSRLPVPSWLSQDFEKSTFVIGLDRESKNGTIRTGLGPGRSIDNRFHLWRKRVSAGEVTLGYNSNKQGAVDAYGIVAVSEEVNSETENEGEQ